MKEENAQSDRINSTINELKILKESVSIFFFFFKTKNISFQNFPFFFRYEIGIGIIQILVLYISQDDSIYSIRIWYFSFLFFDFRDNSWRINRHCGGDFLS